MSLYMKPDSYVPKAKKPKRPKKANTKSTKAGSAESKLPSYLRGGKVHDAKKKPTQTRKRVQAARKKRAKK